MRHSLYKYYSGQKWAEAFLRGELLFRSLSYFRDLEDGQVRGDQNEGTSVYRPEGGLVVTNHTQGWSGVFKGAFKSAANLEEIFVFCLSRSLTERLWEAFGSLVCIEVTDIREFCSRMEAALPPSATFPGKPGRPRIGQPVEYYEETIACNPRWALPDMIASAKLRLYSWQDEYRLVFSLTDALAFEKIQTQLVGDNVRDLPSSAEHRQYLLKAGKLDDICRVHTSANGEMTETQTIGEEIK
jgi:hypothetical protein